MLIYPGPAFSFKNGSDHTPDPVFVDGVEQFHLETPLTDMRSALALSKLPLLWPTFATPLAYPNPTVE
jgi:hypothetical protein